MADFASNYWNWYIAIPSLLGVLVLFPLIYMNRGDPADAGQSTEHVWDDDLTENNNPLPGWWFNMFVITLVFGLLYLLIFPGIGSFSGIIGWSSLGQYEAEMAKAEADYGPLYARFAATDIKTLSEDQAAMQAGERLFATYCATCHGSDARGARGFPNLRDEDWLYGGEPENIVASITNGRTGVMPPLGPLLGGEEGIDEITQYVLSLSGRNHDPQIAAAGSTRYNTTCFACHGATGTGNQLLGAPNLTDRIWLYGSSEMAIKNIMRDGQQGYMPTHGELLGNDKVHLLAAYVYSLSDL